MNQLITEIKNKLDNNHYVEEGEIRALCSYFTDDTIRRIEAIHEQSGAPYDRIIRNAIICAIGVWDKDGEIHDKL